MSQVIQTPEQQVYLSKLLGYDYSIQYKSGKTNLVADALSRITEEPKAQYLILSMPHFTFLSQLKQALQVEPAFQDMLLKVTNDPNDFPDYKVHDGLILFQNKIWLTPTNPFRELLLDEFHRTPLGGHMGINKTLQRLQANFFWEGMRKDV